MIYAHIDLTPDAPKFQQPAAEGFYQRKYIGDDYEPEWTREYWDGANWYYVKGGMVAKTQTREWREITKEGK